MNTYHAFYNGKRIELIAATLYAAKQEAVLKLKAPRSKAHMVSVVLVATPDKIVPLDTASLG